MKERLRFEAFLQRLNDEELGRLVICLDSARRMFKSTRGLAAYLLMEAGQHSMCSDPDMAIQALEEAHAVARGDSIAEAFYDELGDFMRPELAELLRRNFPFGELVDA